MFGGKIATADRSKRPGSWILILWAILLSLVEYHCVLWHQLDLPVYIYENAWDVKDILRNLTNTDYALLQFCAMVVLTKLNAHFIGQGLGLLEKNDWILSMLFSCVLVVGYSFDQIDALDLIRGNSLLLVSSAVCILGYTLLSAAVVTALRGFLRHYSAGERRLPAVWEKHPFLFPMVILLLGWLPYALVRYPAGMEYDAFEQIQQVLTGELKTNNPLLSTLFFGYGFVLGRNLFQSINAGLFFVVVCQMVLCAAMDVYGLLVMHRKRFSAPVQIGVLLLYALSPFIARYTTSIVKDALYSHAVLFLVAALADITDCDVMKNKRKLLLLNVAGLAVCFFRNNGIIVVGATAAVYGLLWLIRQRSKGNLAVVCSIVIPLCVYMLFSKVIIPGMGIPKWRTSEILSLPFQQTARFVSRYEELVTEEEKEIIDAVLDYERIRDNYDPRLSDPVKCTYRGDEEALKVYFQYWLGEFAEHPTTYLSATFNNCYGFFYPDAKEDEDARGTYRDSRWNPDLLAVQYNEFQNRLVMNYGTVTRYLESLPIFYPLCNVAIQIWLFLWIFTSKLASRAKYSRAGLTPVLASVLALIGMPTFSWNGFRYALPVVVAVPFILGLFADSKIQKENLPDT